MRAQVSVLVVSVLAFALSGPTSARQGPSSPVAVSITGTWKLDRQKTKDSQDVWKRRLDAMRAAQQDEAPDAAGMFALRTGHTPYTGEWLLKSAMRDLLEVAERLSFAVSGQSVTITDDLQRALTFATSGNKEKRQLAATEFNVRTRFSGGALEQQMTVDELVMTEIYLPSEDGREMLISINVDKPDFQPPLKSIMRVYTRID
jgi:hypothetical protein